MYSKLFIFKKSSFSLFFKTIYFCFFFLLSCSRSSESVTSDNTPPTPIDPSTNYSLNFTIVGDVFPTNAKFKANLKLLDDSSLQSDVGFVYSTNPNPTYNNNKTLTKVLYGSGDFEFFVDGLKANTTYYVRAYVETSNGKIKYSPEYTFKTTGYFGPGGGYVGYDKGETTNGWRYMEIHPVEVNYDSTFSGAYWGDAGVFISGTYPDFGKGLENTKVIVSKNVGSNCAAKLCYNLIRNGFSDWYLPSSQEIYILTKELEKANIHIPSSAWSSTQYDYGQAYFTYLTIGGEFILTTASKIHRIVDAYPARRY